MKRLKQEEMINTLLNPVRTRLMSHVNHANKRRLQDMVNRDDEIPCNNWPVSWSSSMNKDQLSLDSQLQREVCPKRAQKGICSTANTPNQKIVKGYSNDDIK